jgi:cell division protease FtsH
MSEQQKQKPKKEDRFEWRKGSRTLMFWVLLILLFFLLANAFDKKVAEVEMAPDQFIALVTEESANIDKLRILVEGNEIHGTLLQEMILPDVGSGIPFTAFRVVMPNSVIDEQYALWDEQGIPYSFEKETTNWMAWVLTSILPWVVLLGIWLFIMRRMQGGAGGTRGVFSFGKSKARLQTDTKNKVTFKDVAGADEAKEELQEIIEFLKSPDKFTRLGGRIPKGALLLGPPGTGKTLLARAVAGEAEVPFFSMSGADFVEMFVGVGASRVRDLFEQGKKSAPCIIFIDEMDAVGRQRGAGLGGGHDEREQTLNQLLVEMDGFESNEGVILIAATNRPDVLDPALLRPGRFDRQIVVDRPDVRGREGILKVHTRKIPLEDDIELEVIAKSTPGLAGAELANIVNEAALFAARRGSDKVTRLDFEDAKDKVMMGAERRSVVISDEEKKMTAYHEAGHVLVSKHTPNADPVHKVTIIPRGRALGLTHYLPIDEKHTYSRSYLESMLAHLMGGRVAEELVFGEVTTGAGNDIERATDIARRMVCDWGMSEAVGLRNLGKREEEIFLGREIAQHRDFSEQTAKLIDSEIDDLLRAAHTTARGILKEYEELLHRLALELLEKETLESHEIDSILGTSKGSEETENIVEVPPDSVDGDGKDPASDDSVEA